VRELDGEPEPQEHSEHLVTLSPVKLSPVQTKVAEAERACMDCLPIDSPEDSTVRTDGASDMARAVQAALSGLPTPKSTPSLSGMSSKTDPSPLALPDKYHAEAGTYSVVRSNPLHVGVGMAWCSMRHVPELHHHGAPVTPNQWSGTLHEHSI
jgi:hypothetical protein